MNQDNCSEGSNDDSKSVVGGKVKCSELCINSSSIFQQLPLPFNRIHIRLSNALQIHFYPLILSTLSYTRPIQAPLIPIHLKTPQQPIPTLKMKFTLITLFLTTLFTLIFSAIISAEIRTPTPNPDTMYLSARDPFAEDMTAKELEARRNDCGTPFQNPDCNAGGNLKIGHRTVVMVVFGAVVAGYLL